MNGACVCDVFVQGFVMNVQPSEAEAGFDLRLSPTTDPEEMRRRIATEWAPAFRNMSYEVITLSNLICLLDLQFIQNSSYAVSTC